MLNWADLSTMLMIVAGPLSGVAAAHQHRAGLLVLALFGLLGLTVGVGLGFLSSKIAYSLLRSKTLAVPFKLIVYGVVPAILLYVVILLPALLSLLVYGRG